MFRLEASPSRRKGSPTYEVRVRAPKEVRSLLGIGTHVTRTLGTTDKREAQKRVDPALRKLEAEWQTRIDDLRANASVVEAVGHATLAPQPELSVEGLYQLERERIGRVLASYRQEHVRGDLLCGKSAVSCRNEYAEMIENRLEERKAEYFFGDRAAQHWIARYLERTTERFPDHAEALRSLALAEIDELTQAAAEVRGAPQSATVVNVPAPATEPLLSQFVTNYIIRRDDSLSDERAETIRATARDLALVVGDKRMSDYTKGDAELFERTLLALPANWMKIRELRGLDILKAAERAKTEGMPRQSAKTIRKKWSILSSLFSVAGVSNPFHRRALLVEDRTSANEERDAFSQMELETLLASEMEPPLDWLTSLGLYTGARLNELCQLEVANFVLDHEIPHLRFTSNMRLKNKSSVRAVPLHPALFELGLVEYVARVGAGPLFPNLKAHKTGRYSDAIGKAFARHLRSIGLKRGGISFHSLRHTFAAEVKRRAPHATEQRLRLLGHTSGGMAARYGNSYEAEMYDATLLRERAKIVRGLFLNVRACP